MPVTSATVEDALATTPGTPVAPSAGKLTNDPPPAIAFIVPAPRPARNRNRVSIIPDG